MTTRLYDAGALALAAYARTRFRVRALGAPFRPRAGSLVVSSHRSDADVPVIVAALYRQAHGLRRRNEPLHFAVRDDLFLTGFFAGYPSRLPRLARRALFGVGVGSVLRAKLPCHPIRSATTMRIVEYLRERPDEPVPEPFRVRFPADALARDVLNGKHAQALWTVVDASELDAPEAWARRRAAARDDFRELVAVLQGGRALCIFPEGRPSPDGAIGPVLGGVAALVRRGRPSELIPIAPAYDPLVDGRPHAFVGVGPPVEAPSDAAAVLELLRRTTPLTVGEAVAAALAEGADPHARLAADVEAARAEARPYEPELDDEAVRAARVETAVRRARGRDLDRLVLAYRSARS